MTVNRTWGRLVRALHTVGLVRERDGRIVVSVTEADGVARDVVIVMTPREWEDMALVAAGDVDTALGWVLHAFRDLPADTPFLVYHQYELHASTTPELPVDPEEEAFDSYLREHPEARGGLTLYAYTPGTEPPGVGPESARLGPPVPRPNE